MYVAHILVSTSFIPRIPGRPDPVFLATILLSDSLLECLIEKVYFFWFLRKSMNPSILMASVLDSDTSFLSSPRKMVTLLGALMAIRTWSPFTSLMVISISSPSQMDSLFFRESTSILSPLAFLHLCINGISDWIVRAFQNALFCFFGFCVDDNRCF